MKIFLIYIVLLFLLNCNGEKQQTTAEKCPRAFFSKEHQIYITSDQIPLDIENISYKAELNNYLFNNDCFVSNNVLTVNITLLFVIKPINVGNENILLPFYIATLNAEDKVVDMQYYSVEAVMQKDSETFNYTETEVTKNIVIRIPNKDMETNLKTKMIIGFMLDQEKIELLN